jgi:hypothetical protein
VGLGPAAGSTDSARTLRRPRAALHHRLGVPDGIAIGIARPHPPLGQRATLGQLAGRAQLAGFAVLTLMGGHAAFQPGHQPALSRGQVHITGHGRQRQMLLVGLVCRTGSGRSDISTTLASRTR